MIRNASGVPLNSNPGSLPDVTAALLDWLQPMTFLVLSKSVVNFQNVETSTTYNTNGVRQPYTPKHLEMKPEGERAWGWERFHVMPGIPLKTDDQIVYLGVTYRVVQVNGYPEYGYTEFIAVQDYTG